MQDGQDGVAPLVWVPYMGGEHGVPMNTLSDLIDFHRRILAWYDAKTEAPWWRGRRRLPVLRKAAEAEDVAAGEDREEAVLCDCPRNPNIAVTLAGDCRRLLKRGKRPMTSRKARIALLAVVLGCACRDKSLEADLKLAAATVPLGSTSAGPASVVMQSGNATPPPRALRDPASIADVVKLAGPAVVSIRALDRSGRLMAAGSGFVVVGGRVITNAHVLRGASRADVLDARGRRILSVDYAEAINNEIDLAVLPPAAIDFHPLAVAESAPTVGEKVVAIGMPEGFTNSVSDGIVSAIRLVSGRRRIQLTAPISAGSSGGPVLNERAQVVGAVVSSWSEGQNLNFAVPAADIRAALMQSRGRFRFSPSRSRPVQREASEDHSDVARGEETRRPELGSRWTVLSRSSEAVTGADCSANSLRSSGAYHLIWVKTVFTSDRRDRANRRYRSLITRDLIDCANNRLATQESVIYDADGAVVESSQPKSSLEAVVPESVGEELVAAVCRLLTPRP